MTRIQIRRGTSAQWAAANPVLQQGELAYEIDTNKVKIGDGSAVWNSLGYVSLDWATLAGKPTYLAAGSTKSAARSAIDAEEIIAAGTTSQYYRGDKSFQTLNKSAVGLGDVDNTTDANKPVSTATQSALDGKADDVHLHVTSDVTGLDTALSGKEPSVTSGTTGQYYRGDKSWQTLDKTAVGLSDVDNTSDATKDAASVTLTNKTISGASNTLSNIPQSAVTDLGTDLSAKEDAASKGQANGYASLDGGGKVPVSQLPNSIMEYQGLWNASTNASPTLADGTGSPGDVYRVSVAGSQNLGSGSVSFAVGDYVIYSPATSAWEKADTTDAVSSVNGYTGNVSLTKSDVSLGDVDNTSDANKPVSSATQTALNGKESSIAAGTTSQYWRGDKSFQTLDKAAVGLGNVDNTSNDTERAAAATLTNKTISGSANTLSAIANASLTNSTITIAGTSTALGASITQDTITGLSATGLVKRTGANTLAAASAGTDYLSPSGDVSSCTGQVADLSIVAFGASTTRATGTGDNPFGVKLQRAITFTSVTFRVATADGSGNLVVELRKNGSQVSGTPTTIAAASQVAGGTSTGTWSFAAGDILTVNITGIGATPGKGLACDIKGLTA